MSVCLITTSERFSCSSCPNHAARSHQAVATIDMISFTNSRGGVAEKFVKPSTSDPRRNAFATSLLLSIPLLFQSVYPTELDRLLASPCA